MDKSSVTVKQKSKPFVLPKGATLDNKTIKVEVEEIENGFLITKTIEYSYYPKEQQYRDYKTITKKVFASTNPFDETSSENDTVNKSLVDLFNE